MSKTSSIYKFYEERDEKNLYACKLCQPEETSIAKWTTSLKKHIEHKHKKQYNEYLDLEKNKLPLNKKPKILSVNSRQTYLDDQIKDELLENCIDLVTTCGRPFEIFADGPMIAIIEKTDRDKSKCKINPENLKVATTKKAVNLRNRLQEEIKNKIISLKFEFSNCLHRSFYAINVQFMEKDNIQVRILECFDVFESHTAENIAKWLKNTLKRYNISKNQILTLTTDTAFNIKAAIKVFLSDSKSEDDVECHNDVENNFVSLNSEDYNFDSSLEDSLDMANNDNLSLIKEEYDENYFSDKEGYVIIDIACAAHVIQLAINYFLQSSKEIIYIVSLAQMLASKLKTPILSAMLKTNNQKQAIIMHHIHWSFCYLCLDRLLELKPFCLSNQNFFQVLNISPVNWDAFKTLRDTLKPVAILTKQLQTQSLDVPKFLSCWFICLAELQQQNTKLSSSLLKHIVDREAKLFDNALINAGVYLDKRFNFQLKPEKFLQAKTFIHLIHKKLTAIHNIQSSTADDIKGMSPPHKVSEEFSILEEVLKNREEDMLDSDIDNLQELSECLDIEMNKYDKLNRSKADQDIREFWKSRKQNFPILSQLALLIISVPLTEASAESLFSFLNFMLESHRNRLNDDLLEDIIFLGMNKKFKNFY